MRAQDASAPLIASRIVVVDRDRVLESIGAEIYAAFDFDGKLRELEEEVRRIEDELKAEELELTELRPDLQPTEFRRLADAFDEKVRKIRTEQDNKLASLEQQRVEVVQTAYVQNILPVVEVIARERGALLVLDKRLTLLSADVIDITNETIGRVSAALNLDQQPPLDVTPP
ncbi:Outer membrane protein H precursor [Candidatus Rhodobacter oscarellae]|uniref:Outer membrane protein H n=1 Tax=Candidatus Rhodobacter oscarellae TaxID=1675527 RepID=A0A0J9E638_9RHOB|nr:Outer membrane protein H precursor [Candidatus Rhodobacter lobularis]